MILVPVTEGIVVVVATLSLLSSHRRLFLEFSRRALPLAHPPPPPFLALCLSVVLSFSFYQLHRGWNHPALVRNTKSTGSVIFVMGGVAEKEYQRAAFVRGRILHREVGIPSPLSCSSGIEKWSTGRQGKYVQGWNYPEKYTVACWRERRNRGNCTERVYRIFQNQTFAVLFFSHCIF